MPKAATSLAALLLAAPFCLAAPLAGEARAARHHHRTYHHHTYHHRPYVKAHKTHRVVAGNKSIRINDAGQVITNQNP